MDRTRHFHRFRIGASLACLIACVFFIALWILSYRSLGQVNCKWSATRAVEAVSVNGRMVFFEFPSTTSSAWRSLLDAQVLMCLESDAQMAKLTNQLAYAEMKRAEIGVVARNRRSPKAAQADRQIAVLTNQIQAYRNQVRQQAVLGSLTLSGSQFGTSFPSVLNRSGFGFGRLPFGWMLSVPYWFPVVVSGLLAAALGIGKTWRFSLRTLLIAMILVAMAIGTLAALVR
jgi:hypothetical protein